MSDHDPESRLSETPESVPAAPLRTVQLAVGFGGRESRERTSVYLHQDALAVCARREAESAIHLFQNPGQRGPVVVPLEDSMYAKIAALDDGQVTIIFARGDAGRAQFTTEGESLLTLTVGADQQIGMFVGADRLSANEQFNQDYARMLVAQLRAKLAVCEAQAYEAVLMPQAEVKKRLLDALGRAKGQQQVA